MKSSIASSMGPGAPSPEAGASTKAHSAKGGLVGVLKNCETHASDDGRMYSGTQEAQAGRYHVGDTAYEFFSLLSGQITVIPEQGAPITMRAGDSFCHDRGFKGQWWVQEPARYHYCVGL